METRVDRQKKKDKKINKKQWIFLTAILLAGIIILLALILNRESGNEVYEELRVVTAPTTLPTSTPQQKPKQTEEITQPQTQVFYENGIRPSNRSIDFEALTKRNKDVIGWVEVPGTNVDYPILKSKDNTDYLERDINKKENIAGAIFTDMYNKEDFSDPITVIYGHNMKNGSMFASLHSYADKDFFDTNRQIILYTKEGMRIYEIFAAYTTDDKNILYKKDYTNVKTFEEYINSIKSTKDLQANITIEKISNAGITDNIITLSTCIKDEPNNRYIIQGILKKDE